MNDEQIRKVFTEANNVSQTHALRAVYKAGQNHDVWLVDERRRAEDGRVDRRRTELNEKARVEEEKRVADEKRTPEEKQLADSIEEADKEREVEAKRVAEEKRLVEEKVVEEEAKREKDRIAALESGFDADREAERNSGKVPSADEIAKARAEAVKSAKKEGLSVKEQEVVADEAEAQLKVRK